MGNSKFIIQFHAVGVGFQKKNQKTLLLENLDLKIKTGELIGLIGRNGAGKSTLLRTMVRLQKLVCGKICIREQNILHIDPNAFAQKIAYVSSAQEFTETMTVKELVSLGRFPYTNWIGKLTMVDNELINEALKSVDIEHLENRKLSEISDGERQKAMIARTLAQDTPIIVLDEPTAFLDLPSKYDIINLLFELTRKGKTVIYSSHDLNIALRFSDKIWLIDNKMVHNGSPEDLILDNTIAGIFNSDKIQLNIMSGDFELRNCFTKRISIQCEIPEIKHWTIRALQRSGYEIVEKNSNISHITIERGKTNIIWRIQDINGIRDFESIYEMLSIF